MSILQKSNTKVALFDDSAYIYTKHNNTKMSFFLQNWSVLKMFCLERKQIWRKTCFVLFAKADERRLRLSSKRHSQEHFSWRLILAWVSRKEHPRQSKNSNTTSKPASAHVSRKNCQATLYEQYCQLTILLFQDIRTLASNNNNINNWSPGKNAAWSLTNILFQQFANKKTVCSKQMEQ